MQVLVCPEKSRPEENKEQVVLQYTAAVDAWAIGIVCFELMVGHPPFEKKSQSQTYEHIMYRAPEMPASLSSGAKQFITSALVKVRPLRNPCCDSFLALPCQLLTLSDSASQVRILVAVLCVSIQMKQLSKGARFQTTACSIEP